MLSELAGQQQTDGGLDLAARDRRALIVVSETGGLGGDTLEDVVHERIHDAHRLARDTGIGVHLLQNLVDVDSVALPPSSTVLLVTATWRLHLADGLLGALRCCFGRHVFNHSYEYRELPVQISRAPFIVSDNYDVVVTVTWPLRAVIGRRASPLSSARRCSIKGRFGRGDVIICLSLTEYYDHVWTR